LAAASVAALGEGRRETSPFTEKNKSSSDGSEVKELFNDLKSGLGFGDDDDSEKHQDTYIERFEAPGLEVYEELAADRAVIRAMQRSEGFGLVAAPELNAYVNRVLQRIVAASPVPDLDVRAFVRAEPEFSAHSTPDGSIYVTIQLLQDIASEDELAAVLAHELAHVLHRHHGTDWFANSQKMAAQVLSLKDAAKGSVKGDTSGEPSKTTLLTAVAGELSERVVAPNLWNREQEREADGLGFDLLIAARYLSSAAFTALERLAYYEAQARERARERMDHFAKETEADINETIESGDLSQIMVGLVENAGKVLDVASESAIDTIGGGNHDPAEVRIERLDEYAYRAYEDDPRPDSTNLPWQTLADPTSTVLANYLNASKAGIALDEGKLGEAESLSRLAVSGPTKADAFPRFIFSRIRAQQGDLSKSYRNLEIASDGPEPAFVVYSEMIKAQLIRGRKDEAVRLVEEAARRLGQPPNLYPYQIAVLVEAQKKARALALFAECKVTYPDLAPQCNRALGGLREVAADEGEADDDAADLGVGEEGGSLVDKLFGGEGVDPTKALTTGFTGQ
jgi:Zn-dependent protease with chaperone function